MAAHWSEDQYVRMFQPDPRRVVLVADDGTGLAGFVVAVVCGDEWEIENVAVSQEARRTGLGTRLVAELLDRARAEGAQAVLLEVRESNRAARALYEKSAFAEAGRRRAYYRNPDEDAIIYRLDFECREKSGRAANLQH